MYDYTYDDGGNLTSKTHTIAGTQDYTASYTYDSNMTDLLTGYTKTSSDGTVTTQTYDYTGKTGERQGTVPCLDKGGMKIYTVEG